MSITGPPGGEPTKVGVALVDVLTGLYAFGGVLAALRERDRTGRGQRVEVSLLGSALASLVNQASSYLCTGRPRGPWATGTRASPPMRPWPPPTGRWWWRSATTASSPASAGCSACPRRPPTPASPPTPTGCATATSWRPCSSGPWPPVGRPTGWPTWPAPGCPAAWSTTSARRSPWPSGSASAPWSRPTGSPRWPTRSGCRPPRLLPAGPAGPRRAHRRGAPLARRSPTRRPRGSPPVVVQLTVSAPVSPGCRERLEGEEVAAPCRHPACAGVSSRGGGRQVSMAETGGRGSRPGELHRRRVVLLAESAGLAAVLNHLLDPADRLSRIGSLRELAESRPSTAPTWSSSTCPSRTAPTPSGRSAGASWGRWSPWPRGTRAAGCTSTTPPPC